MAEFDLIEWRKELSKKLNTYISQATAATILGYSISQISKIEQEVPGYTSHERLVTRATEIMGMNTMQLDQLKDKYLKD